LTFAITPALFTDDGPQATADLKAKIASEKSSVKRRPMSALEEDDEDV
jgi:hypothetical protein